MNRAERRRQKKSGNKKKAVLNITADSLEAMQRQMYEKARKDIMKDIDKLGDEMFKMMLVIPTNILISDYWEKSAKKRIPQFVDSCLSLYDSWCKGQVDMDEMVKLTEEYAHIKMVEDGTKTWHTLHKRGQL